MGFSSGFGVNVLYFLAPGEASHHIAYDLLSGVLLRLDGSVQLAQHEDAQLLVLQQAAHFFHVEPADPLTVQDALHHFLQELLVLAEWVRREGTG